MHAATSPNDPQVLGTLARRNGTRAPDQPLADVAASGGTQNEEAAGKQETLWAALRDWHIGRRFFILAYTSMVMSMSYYVSALFPHPWGGCEACFAAKHASLWRLFDVFSLAPS